MAAMRDDSASFWGMFLSNRSMSGRNGDLQRSDGKVPGASPWRRVCQQPKYVFCVVLTLGVIFILSTVVVDEQLHTSSFLDRLASSFKTDGRFVNGTDGCDLARNVMINSTDDVPSNSNSTNDVPSNSKSTDDVPRKSCRQGTGDLPQGIVVPTTDLQPRSLYEEDQAKVQKAMKKNLLAMTVGIRQKKWVDQIVQKFPLKNFTIMLFHYDGIVDQWQDLPWSNQSIHIVALDQTKWWFAKRFMHPDIVDQYNYIFLWDEDLGVKHFHADRYLKIMEAEGFEISQPALDPASVQIHHSITRLQRGVIAHRQIHTNTCPPTNKQIPCTGYLEVMAPVFTKAAWKCVWHMIQNDLVHVWGMGVKLGYCAQGLRSEKMGVIDAEYVLHMSIPSLGGPHVNKTIVKQVNSGSVNRTVKTVIDPREEVRKRSRREARDFQRRWTQAVLDDPTWVDPYISV